MSSETVEPVTSRPIVPQIDKQFRHRRGSFNHCGLSSPDTVASMCSSPSEPSICREMFDVSRNSGYLSDSSGIGVSRNSSGPPEHHHTKFTLPSYPAGHLEQFKIVKQLGSGRSGALVFLVRGGGSAKTAKTYVLKVYLNALTPSGHIDNDRVYRELYALCRLSSRPGFECTICFGLAPLPQHWVRMPKFIGDVVPIDVRLWPSDPALQSHQVAFVLTTVARGVPLADLPLYEMSQTELAGTALEIVSVWQTMRENLSTTPPKESEGFHGDLHVSNIFVSLTTWRRAPIETAGLLGDMVFPYVTFIDFDLTTSDAFPAPNPTVAFSPFGVREATLQWTFRHLGPADAVIWLTALAHAHKTGLLPANNSDVYHLLTYLLVFAKYHHAKNAKHASSSSSVLRRALKALPTLAAGQYNFLSIWHALTTAKEDSGEQPIGPDDGVLSSFDDNLERSAALLGQASRTLTATLQNVIAQSFDMTLPNLQSVTETLQAAFTNVISEQQVTANQSPHFATALQTYRQQNHGLWPDPDHVAIRLTSTGLERSAAIHMSLDIGGTMQLPLYFIHQNHHDGNKPSITIKTEGLGTLHVHVEDNTAIYAPGWGKLLLHHKLIDQLKSEPLRFEVETYPPMPARHPEDVRLILHPPAVDGVPPDIVALTRALVWIETIDLRASALDISLTATFRLALGRKAVRRASIVADRRLPAALSDEGTATQRNIVLPVVTGFFLRLAVAVLGWRLRKQQKLVMVELDSKRKDVLILNIVIPPGEPAACIGAVVNTVRDREVYLPDTLDCIAGLQQFQREHFNSPQQASQFLLFT